MRGGRQQQALRGQRHHLLHRPGTGRQEAAFQAHRSRPKRSNLRRSCSAACLPAWPQMLLNRYKQDPSLAGLEYLVIDEVHERSTNIDLILGVLRMALPTAGFKARRPSHVPGIDPSRIQSQLMLTCLVLAVGADLGDSQRGVVHGLLPRLRPESGQDTRQDLPGHGPLPAGRGRLCRRSSPQGNESVDEAAYLPDTPQSTNSPLSRG